MDAMAPARPPAARRPGGPATAAALVVLATLMVTGTLVGIATGPAGRVAAAGADVRPEFSWPLRPPPPVAGAFDPPEHRYGTGHRGVDLAASPGQRVLAADAGVVVFAGQLAGRGVVSIQHDGGLRTTYEPVRAGVTEGTHVHRGQPVGTVRAGHPGCSASACLHWGVRRQDRYLNPLTLVRTDITIRLKPW